MTIQTSKNTMYISKPTLTLSEIEAFLSFIFFEKNLCGKNKDRVYTQIFNKAQAISLSVSIQLFRVSETSEINYNMRLKLSAKPKCCLCQIKKANSVLLIIKCIKLNIDSQSCGSL